MDDRLKNLRALMKEQKVDAALVSSVPNIIYLTNFSHFLTSERDGYLLITQNKQYLITSGLYAQAAKTNVKNLELLVAESGKSFVDIIKEIVQKNGIQTLGIEKNNLTVSEYEKLDKTKTLIKSLDLSKFRLIKTNSEIKTIQKACEIGDKAYSHILKHLRIGITERDIMLELEWFIRKQNADISFDPIVAFGANAAIPHHKSSNQKLKSNQLILLDFGVKFDNYCSDMSRTFFFGQANTEEKKVYQTVLSAQEKAINYIKKALIAKNVVRADIADKTARDHILSLGFPSFPHRLGHGIGLEAHEAPSLYYKTKESLENGMVFSIEPGIYLPDKFGVRIEDLFAIVDNKLIPLTHSPKELIEI